MKGTFSQILVHIIIRVKNGECRLPGDQPREVFEYLSSMLRARGQNPLAVGGTSDHVHLFIGMKPGSKLCSLVREIKTNSANFINLKGWMGTPFSWENGYAAFTYGYSQVETMKDYINRQAEHHGTISFRDEYIAFLRKFEVEFREEDIRM